MDYHTRYLFYANTVINLQSLQIEKKLASGRVWMSKPGASPLHAEVPCNYTHGRLAAALQSVFESPHDLAPVFFSTSITVN